MVFKKFEEFQEKRLYKKTMSLTMPEKTGDNYIESNELHSVNYKGEENINIVKEEDARCKDLEFVCVGNLENENDETPSQKIDSIKIEVEDDDQLDIVKKEEAFKDLEFVSVGHWENENDEPSTQKVGSVKSEGEFVWCKNLEIGCQRRWANENDEKSTQKFNGSFMCGDRNIASINEESIELTASPEKRKSFCHDRSERSRTSKINVTSKKPRLSTAAKLKMDFLKLKIDAKTEETKIKQSILKKLEESITLDIEIKQKYSKYMSLK